jgi:hypothetical protein
MHVCIAHVCMTCIIVLMAHFCTTYMHICVWAARSEEMQHTHTLTKKFKKYIHL